jgi:hypothetical protein
MFNIAMFTIFRIPDYSKGTMLKMFHFLNGSNSSKRRDKFLKRSKSSDFSICLKPQNGPNLQNAQRLKAFKVPVYQLCPSFVWFCTTPIRCLLPDFPMGQRRGKFRIRVPPNLGEIQSAKPNIASCPEYPNRLSHRRLGSLPNALYFDVQEPSERRYGTLGTRAVFIHLLCRSNNAFKKCTGGCPRR